MLNGRDLRRKVDDLDVFLSNAAFARLRDTGKGVEYEKSPGVFALRVPGLDKIELLRTFPGVVHEEVLHWAKVGAESRGVLVAALQDLIIWKQTQGRAKDKADLRHME